MANPVLGKLTTVSLRELFKNEERDFTPWLVENIGQLSDLLGLSITVDQTEKRVGNYELDIFGHGPEDVVVIVENQLDQTDHMHLGQILTYAAGLDAAVIVWVAPDVRDEHRRAIEWLNDKTADGIAFFLVRPEALSIDGSHPAVRFNLEAGPSNFVRELRAVAQDSPWQKFCRKFWADLYPYLVAHGHSWALGRSPTTERWIYSAVGKTGVSVYVTLDKKQPRVSVSIWLEGEAAANKKRFDLLRENEVAIRAEFPGQDLKWDREESRAGCGVYVDHLYEKEKISEATPEREALFSWIAENLTRSRTVARRYLVEPEGV